jgi:hypothetical protein
MAVTAWETVQQSGDVSLSVKKDKSFGFRDRFELERHIEELLASQEGLCALTGLNMLFDDEGDPDLRCSLDRIESKGHYTKGNLQIVCRFANRWKGASDNGCFLNLIERVRMAGARDTTIEG